jgi:hypothetical protein
LPPSSSNSWSTVRQENVHRYIGRTVNREAVRNNTSDSFSDDAAIKLDS